MTTDPTTQLAEVLALGALATPGDFAVGQLTCDLHTDCTGKPSQPLKPNMAP